MKKTILIASLILSNLTFSAEKGGVTVPDKMKLNESELVLNGVGIRRATFLNIKVYIGSLYTPQKSTDTATILNMPFPKHISMNFVRDVDKEDLQGAWKEGFEAAVPEAERKAMMVHLEAFNKTMGDIKKNQAILINFLNNGVEVSFNGTKHPLIGDANFSKALLSIWFVNARDEELRDEMLGKN
ncbi:MAG: chalcone isomerase family protein [Bacteriovoracaceae bacterium]|nr:chalcone isomerase family protein [Bacteriovoracaceae bacterium]